MKQFWIINLVFFQACWFLAAFLQSDAVLWMLLLFAIHFILSPTRKLDLLVLPMAMLGFLIDQVLIYTGVIAIESEWLPAWLALLWLGLVLCLNHSLAWLFKLNLLWVALIGAVSAPFSYYGGLEFGAFETSVSLYSFFAVFAIIWAVVLPLLILGINQIKMRQRLL